MWEKNKKGGKDSIYSSKKKQKQNCEVPKTKSDQKTNQDLVFLSIERLNIVKIFILPGLICRFMQFQLKSQPCFRGTSQLILGR